MLKTVRRCAARILLLLLVSVKSYTQGLFPVSLDEKISQSSLIAEGKVISQSGFWNPAHTLIYTASQVEIYKTFKGTLQKELIQVITTGGTVGDRYLTASHLLHLETSDIGIFFCRQSPNIPTPPGNTTVTYEVYSSAQGFLKYDYRLREASAPFVHYFNIKRQLYRDLQTRTGRKPSVVNGLFSLPADRNESGSVDIMNQVLAPSITSFTPAVVNAGALLDPSNNILTINGTGFGASPALNAAVLFDNPDDGSGGSYSVVAYNSPLIISWTDTQIKLQVPSQSGTGVFYVRDNGGTLVASPSKLTVGFAVLDAAFLISGSLLYKEMRLVNKNGLGGYTIKYSSNTSNGGINVDASPAKATFQRAMTTWHEGSGFNVTEGGTDTLQTIDPYDTTNLVVYDNSAPGNSPLPAGVLAVCYSSGAFCGDNIPANQAYRPGFDIVIRNNGVSQGASIAFTYGPCSPYGTSTSAVDLEAVMFHELGHAIGLGHIIGGSQGSGPATTNPAQVMNYAITPGIRRISEDYSSQNGSLYIIIPKGSLFGNCDPLSEMTPLATIAEPRDDCPATFPVTTTPANTTVAFDLVHATSNKSSDPSWTQLTTNGSGSEVTNTAFYAFKTNGTGGNLILTVSGYNTVPASAASCTVGPPGIPVTGIQLVVYQVAACPAGQSFPTPIVSTSFQGDGIITNVTGLASNTTYLMLMDGVENTKAYFDMNFSGAALPLRITTFAGEAIEGSNKLRWITELADGVDRLQLERSGNGNIFIPIDPSVAVARGNYIDADPFMGNNYYRLAVINADGSTQYSRVILLYQREGATVSVYPNPASGILQLDLRQLPAGRYTVRLYNTIGQPVREKKIFVSTGSVKENINVSNLSSGLYHLRVLRANGSALRSLSVAIR